MTSWRALGGMLTSPLRTLRAVASAGTSPVLPLLLLLFVTACAEAASLGRLAYLFEQGHEVILRRMRDALFDPLRTDLTILAITCAVLALLGQLRAGGRVSPARAAAAGVWLLIPLVVVKALGAALAGLSVDLWWMPHHAVDSWAILEERKVSWLRFATKCVTAYAWPLAVALPFALRLRGEEPHAPDPSRVRSGLALAGVLLALLCASTVLQTVRLLDRIRPTLVGDLLPDAAMRRIDASGVKNTKLKLASLRGKVVVLDFWASWCAPCRRSMPELSALAEELGPRGLVVLGVNRDSWQTEKAAEALAAIRPKFDSVIDERGYGDRIGITTLPTSYIVDRRGIVRAMHFGYTEPARLRAELEPLLGEP